MQAYLLRWTTALAVLVAACFAACSGSDLSPNCQLLLNCCNSPDVTAMGGSSSCTATATQGDDGQCASTLTEYRAQCPQDGGAVVDAGDAGDAGPG